MDFINELKSLLSSLDYEDIAFVSFDESNTIVYFDAFIDTYYRVMCKKRPNNMIEIYDTTFDVDNYVFIATARRINKNWKVQFDKCIY